nr:MAG TPA: DNA adenine methylase [Caudoviricetes sp.]
MRTPITYYGGKQTMLQHILPLIPKHDIYTEAFCGGAAVFFAKQPAPSEVINDLNSHLVCFYTMLQAEFPTLKSRIDATLHSRDAHAHAAHVLAYPQFFTQMDRAWAVWVLSKMSFASMLDGTFGYDFQGSMTKRLRNAKDCFTQILSDRLDNVTIECRDALDVIALYDSPETFHFVDPPYVGSDCGHYEGVFGELHLVQLLELLSQLKGKFMLTMFPHDKIAEFANNNGWITHTIERTISASKVNRRKQEEWIVCNYEQEDKQPMLFE